MERRCLVCNAELKACFGYVIARDFIDYIENKREDIREVCGRDVLKLELESERRGVGIDIILNEFLYA
jgi:hypothetical protein